MEQITEEMQVHKQWYEEAQKQTVETLPAFLEKLTKDYKHDYGTICHAMAAGAIATVWAMDKSDQGGITGFQAGAIMWEFIGHWNYPDNKIGMRLINYDNLLYPQYEDEFTQKTISTNQWNKLQEIAKEKLIEDENHTAAKSVRNHWQRIVDGIIPFGYTLKSNENGK